MLTKKISVSLLTFLIAIPAFSNSVVESEFELKIPRQFQQSLLEQKWKSLMTEKFQANWRFPDQMISNEGIPVQMKGLTMNVQSFLQKPALSEGQTALELTSKDLSSQLKIDEISVDHIVERNVGGIIGRFRVQVSCRGLVLGLKPGAGHFSMRLRPQVQGNQASAVVDNVNLSWTAGSWNVGEMKCSGAQGFENIIVAEVQRIANDSKSFIDPQKELLKKSVQEYVGGSVFDFSQPRTLMTARPDIEVLMKVQETKDLAGEGLLAKGLLAVKFLRVDTDSHQLLKLSESALAMTGSNALLRLPENFIKVVLTEAYKAGTWKHQISSKKLPGFSSLMASRFSQWFVWPELMKYSKSASFLFDVYSNEDVQISGAGLQYNVKAPLYSLMKAPRSGVHIPFMNLKLPFSSKVQIQLQAGKAQAKFVNPTLGLTGSYVSSYSSKYSPSSRFKAATIRDKIVESIWGQTVGMTLPLVPVAEGLALRIEKLVSGGTEDLLLQLKP